jgi:AraC-like DNA-binding protein
MYNIALYCTVHRWMHAVEGFRPQLFTIYILHHYDFLAAYTTATVSVTVDHCNLGDPAIFNVMIEEALQDSIVTDTGKKLLCH